MNDNDLFYTCSLIEYMARETHNRRSDNVTLLGDDTSRIYKYAGVFHCEPIEKVADAFIQKGRIPTGNYDNLIKRKYSIPD